MKVVEKYKKYAQLFFVYIIGEKWGFYFLSKTHLINPVSYDTLRRQKKSSPPSW